MKTKFLAVAVAGFLMLATTAPAWAESTQDILRQGLLGAGVGAISAGASHGKAGTGALIGAGTTVIGGALLDMLTNQNQSYSNSQTYYTSYASAPVQTVYQQPAQIAYPPAETVYTESQPVYYVESAPVEHFHRARRHRQIVRTYDAFGNLVSQRIVWE